MKKTEQDWKEKIKQEILESMTLDRHKIIDMAIAKTVDYFKFQKLWGEIREKETRQQTAKAIFDEIERLPYFHVEDTKSVREIKSRFLKEKK